MPPPAQLLEPYVERSRAEAEGLVRRSVTLAREVRDEVAGDGRRRLVAASVGPYGAVLADGSEYRGRYGLSASELRDFHAPRLELLASSAPDLFAVETIPDVDEALVLVELLDEVGIPAWFTYSVRESRTCAGQSLSEANDALVGSSSILAAGVNCSHPDEVLGAVRASVTATGLPAVAYPNKGGSWDSATRTWEGRPSAWAAGITASSRPHTTATGMSRLPSASRCDPICRPPAKFAAAMARLDRLDDVIWRQMYGLSPQACAAVRQAFASWPRTV